MKNLLSRKLFLLAIVLAAPACSDLVGPVDHQAPDPAPEAPRPLVAVACTANLHANTVECGAPGLDGPSAVMIGGQNTYVTLTSGNVAVTADTFAFDLTVTNLIQQPLGTTDFSTLDPEGVRVFFQSPPVGVGGTVTVANPDGTGTFTASNQPYFQYNEIIETDSTSAAKRFKLRFTAGTESVSWLLLVAADVPYPNGYILGNPYVLTLDPNEVRTLTGTVYSFVGNVLAGETITWTSQNPALVSVIGDQATAGASRGFTEITLDSEGRPSDFTTAVSVCQSAVVANGHSSAQSVAATDCFSAFGSNQFRPSTSYYGDLFRVALTAGQVIEITLDSGDDLDTYLILADPSGLAVAVNDDDDEETLGVGSRVVYTATATGVHVFEASTFNGLDTGNYQLVVTIS